MSITTYTVNTFRVDRSNEGFPNCPDCGSSLIVEDHFRRRKPKEVYATVARCPDQKCCNKNGWIGYDYDDLKTKLNKKIHSLG